MTCVSLHHPLSLSSHKMKAPSLVNQQKLKNSFFAIDVNQDEDEEEDMEESFDINLVTDSGLVGEKSFTSGSNAENQSLAKLFEENPFNSSSSSSGFISRRRTLPFKPISKLQSPPMAILKPSPTASFFCFRSQKSVAARTMEERETKTSQIPESKQKKEKGNSFRFRRKSCVRRSAEEAMNKYFKLIKSFCLKASKIYSDEESPYPSPSPANKLFGKRKSWSAANNLSSPAFERRDDSLLLHLEGIESAIYHCKKSFDTSRDSSSSSSSSNFFGDHPASENPRTSAQRDFSGSEMMDVARTMMSGRRR